MSKIINIRPEELDYESSFESVETEDINLAPAEGSWIFEDKKVEVIEIDDEVLFNAKDVADVLGITDVKSAIRNFNEKQKITLTNSKVQDMHFRKIANRGESFLTESGVYKLAFRSNKPSAEKFTDWVTEDVLPSVRKHGGYIATNENMTDEEIMARALLVANKTIEEKNKRLQVAEDENLKLSEIIKNQEPKMEYIDEILRSEDAMLVTNIAFDYGLSAVALNRILEEERVQRKIRGQWILYSDYLDKGYTKTGNKGNKWQGSSTDTMDTEGKVIYTRVTGKKKYKSDNGPARNGDVKNGI